MLGACNSDSDATLAEPSEPRRAAVATESRPDIGRTLGQEIVRKGAEGSTADRLAFAQAANGDSSYLKTLTSIRALHARSLDSAIAGMSPKGLVLASPEAVGHANYQVESGGIELSSAGTGVPTIVAVNTTGTFTSNGATSNLTGHVSFRGSSVNARVEWQSANFEGSLPSVQGSFNGYDLEPNLVAYGQCVRDNPTNYGVACAGFASYYTTITPPSIELGQPCGTRVHAHTEATAKWDLWVLGAVLDMLGPIPWSLMGSPIFYSDQFVEGTRIIGPNNQCVPPIAAAAFGGSATGSGGEYSATIPSGASTVEVSIYGWVTNAPLPAAEEYLLELDGNAVTPIQGTTTAVVDVGVGTHTLVFTARDPLLGLVGTASATLNVTTETCTETGGGTATLRADPALGSVCGSQTGSPGGGEGSQEPSEPAPPNCQWVRYFVIYSDGSWDWLGGWEHECEGDEMLRAPTGGPGRLLRATAMNIVNTNFGVQSPSLQIRLLGSGPLGSGRSIEIHQYPTLDVDAVIRIDLTRATAADLETAFSVAEAIANRPNDRHVGAIQGPPSKKAQSRSGPSSRADAFLKALSQATQRNAHLFGLARSLDITIDRNAVTTSDEPNRRQTPQLLGPKGSSPRR